MENSDTRQKFLIGHYPEQCGICGRELRNMGCNECSPFVPPVRKNRGGFSKFGQLTVKTQTGPPSPRKQATTSTATYEGFDGEPLKLITDITGIVGPSIENGNHRPFLRRAREGQEYTVLAKFEWADHKWECNIPCDKDTSRTQLFKRLCIYFQRFVEAIAKEKCNNSHACLCGGPNSSVTQEDVRIFGYDLIYNIDGTSTIIVKAGQDL